MQVYLSKMHFFYNRKRRCQMFLRPQNKLVMGQITIVILKFYSKIQEKHISIKYLNFTTYITKKSMLRHIDFRFSQLQGIISCKENGMYVRKNSIFTASGEKKSPNKIQNCSRSSHVECVLRRVETLSFYFSFSSIGLSIFSYYILQGRRRVFFQFFFFYLQKLSRIFSFDFLFTIFS